MPKVPFRPFLDCSSSELHFELLKPCFWGLESTSPGINSAFARFLPLWFRTQCRVQRVKPFTRLGRMHRVAAGSRLLRAGSASSRDAALPRPRPPGCAGIRDCAARLFEKVVFFIRSHTDYRVASLSLSLSRARARARSRARGGMCRPRC